MHVHMEGALSIQLGDAPIHRTKLREATWLCVIEGYRAVLENASEMNFLTPCLDS